MFPRSLTIAALALLATATPSFSQGAPSVAPANNIDDRVRQQVRLPTERERTEALMTGDSDIILTRKTKLFSLSGSLEFSGTSNAFLSPTAPVSDELGQLQINLGVGTRIADKVDVFASIGTVGVRYFDNKALNYNAFTAAVGARTSIGPVNLTASYQPTIVLSGNYKRRQLTSHRFALGASIPFRLKQVTIEPSIGGERVIANPSDYDAWSGGAGITFSTPLSRKKPIFAYASGRYQYRSFDSYFTGLVGTDRRDNGWSADLGLVWRPARWGEVRASYSFQRNRSTSDVNAYKAHSGSLGLSAALRF